jgi:hypothetical protein
LEARGRISDIYKHFAKQAELAKYNNILPRLDKHENKLYFPTTDFCRKNDIILVPFHPQCCHHLQPLVVAACGPLESFTNAARDSPSKKLPGTRMTIYDIPHIVGVPVP